MVPAWGKDPVAPLKESVDARAFLADDLATRFAARGIDLEVV